MTLQPSESLLPPDGAPSDEYQAWMLKSILAVTTGMVSLRHGSQEVLDARVETTANIAFRLFFLFGEKDEHFKLIAEFYKEVKKAQEKYNEKRKMNGGLLNKPSSKD